MSQSARVERTLREALEKLHFPATSVYKARRNSIVSIGISEWAASLSVFAIVVRRILKCATAWAGAVKTPLQQAMDVTDAYTSLVDAAYFSPRVELGGAALCRPRVSPKTLQTMAEAVFSLVRAECVRRDLAIFRYYLDVPDLHRLRELVDHVIPALLHVRHHVYDAQEHLFENAHKPLKSAAVSGRRTLPET